jgi:hypothetical protein
MSGREIAINKRDSNRKVEHGGTLLDQVLKEGLRR